MKNHLLTSLTLGVLLSVLLPVSAQVAAHTPAKFTVPSVQLPIPTGKPVARVNGAVLTDRDLLREEYAIFPYAKQHGGTIPQNMESGIRKGALEMIIFEELVYQEAQKQKLTVPPERLAKAQKEFQKQFTNTNEYQQFLRIEFQGKEPLVRSQIKRSLLIEEFLQRNVTKKSVVSPVELKAFYDKSGSRFAYPESFAIQTISAMPPANATAAQVKDARKRADDALKQAKTTKTAEEFGLLAEKISDDDYRVMMGDHKWIERDKMPPEMLQPALKMKLGDISDVAQVGQYYVIFRLNGHVQPGKFKFDKVKNKLRMEVEQQKTEKLRAALNKKLRQGAKVETL